MKSITFANNLSRRFNYKNNINKKICFFTLQNKLKSIIIMIVKLKSIFTCNITKIFKSTFVKNIKISQIKI